MSIIVAPEARSSKYDSHNPIKENAALKRIEKRIIRLRLWLNCSLKAAGIVNRAITRIIPTILINNTTVSAVKHKMSRYRILTGIPRITENSSSKEIARSSLYKAITSPIITRSRIAIIIRSVRGTVSILPKR